MTGGGTHGSGLRTVLVWHRWTLVRDGLVVALSRGEPPWAAVAAERADDLPGLCLEVRPSAAVVDLADGSDEQWEALKRMTGRGAPRLVGLYRSLDTETARRAFEFGVRSVVALDEGLDGVVDALTPADWRATSFASLEREEPILDPLERSVLRLVGLGLSTREAAVELALTRGQVDGAKQRAFAKLGVQDQAHALAVALRQGLLEVPE